MAIGLTQMEGGITVLVGISFVSGLVSILMETHKYYKDAKRAGTFDPRQKDKKDQNKKQSDGSSEPSPSNSAAPTSTQAYDC